jgi:hypothetical protein
VINPDLLAWIESEVIGTAKVAEQREPSFA